MDVFEVEDGMVVRPNCAYIIPPNRDMALLSGKLHLLEQATPRGLRMPIDFFFRSLAMDQRERAIGIVLSGTGSDGTLGVRAIKSEGGMVMAQSPESTEYEGMPRSAIETGLVDYILKPAQMPPQLVAYAAHPGGRPPGAGSPAARITEGVHRKVLILLRDQTGHDFSQYKQSTIGRRIERRLAVNQISTVDDYIKYAQQTPAEISALFGDLLIGVTSFFRDAEAFEALEREVIPKLVANKPSGSTIRVWSPGCSTGEEPYSLAVLLRERLDTLQRSVGVQLFATDLSPQSVVTARAGRYAPSIAADISPERLERNFVLESDASAFRIRKSIRDMLIFSEQDLIRDPPLSKLDLIVCRNVLIYMGAALQKKLIPLFHYALNPGGYLFLGTSETVGQFSDLFTVVDRKWRLYQRREDLAHAYDAVASWGPRLSRTAPARTATAVAKAGDPRKQTLRELTEQALLHRALPSGALVNGKGDILYLHGRTGMFLEPTTGEVGVSNIVRMAREGLQREMASALRDAAKTKEPTRRNGLRVRTNGSFSLVNLAVYLVTVADGLVPEAPLYLVTLEVAPAGSVVDGRTVAESGASLVEFGNPDVEAGMEALRQELRTKEELLQTSNEELETSNEELMSSNEEMQSVNEELQSANEELETSREELQSVNEELATTNAELQTKVFDLSRANDDNKNLLAGTGIGTVFLDRSLRILRFTPAVLGIVNLIPSDIGRPLAHVVSNFVGYDRLPADAEEVLDTLIPRETEVETSGGKWYAMRMLPYRTLDNVIEGVVLTFADITETRVAKQEAEDARVDSRWAIVARDSRDALVVRDLEGRILVWNSAAQRSYGWTEAEALALSFSSLVPEDHWEEESAKAGELSAADGLEPYRSVRLTKAGERVAVLVTGAALSDESGAMYAIASTEKVSPSAGVSP